MSDPAEDHYADVMNQYSEMLGICVLPIFYLEGESSCRHAGTGFLVATQQNDYLVSAAHVFNPYKENKDLFFFVGDKKIRKLNGKLRVSEDPLDIGVLKLSDEHRPPYTEVNKKSLKITSLVSGQLPRQGKQYMVTGFPASRSKPNWHFKEVKSELRPFLSGSLPHQEYETFGIEPHEHLLLAYDKKHFFMLNDNRQVTSLAPHGLSGSPVWLVLDRVNENDPSRTPLIGVVIEYDPRKKFVKACDIGFGLALIEQFENAV